LFSSAAVAYGYRVRVYALVSYHVQSIVEVFSTREKAEAFLAEVRSDDPELAAMLGNRDA
jgi:hypothetical protein